jgi:hypothetical protein
VAARHTVMTPETVARRTEPPQDCELRTSMGILS